MSHHHKCLLRYNLKELLTQEFQTLLSKRKQRELGIMTFSQQQSQSSGPGVSQALVCLAASRTAEFHVL